MFDRGRFRAKKLTTPILVAASAAVMVLIILIIAIVPKPRAA
jgi:hypothetical protein